jgi:hypothetical protein
VVGLMSQHFETLRQFLYFGGDFSSKLQANIRVGCCESCKSLTHGMYACTDSVLCTMYRKRIPVQKVRSIQLATVCPSACV